MKRFDDQYDEKKEADRRMKEIILSTGNINRSYVVRDVIYVAERFDVDLFDKEVDVDQAMNEAKIHLQEKAARYGADAVINCHFDHEYHEKEGHSYSRIFAYGTVVQFIQSTIGG